MKEEVWVGGEWKCMAFVAGPLQVQEVRGPRESFHRQATGHHQDVAITATNARWRPLAPSLRPDDIDFHPKMMVLSDGSLRQMCRGSRQACR